VGNSWVKNFCRNGTVPKEENNRFTVSGFQKKKHGGNFKGVFVHTKIVWKKGKRLKKEQRKIPGSRNKKKKRRMVPLKGREFRFLLLARKKSPMQSFGFEKMKSIDAQHGKGGWR